LGRDPLAVDPAEIDSIPVDMTLVGGRVRWARPGLPAPSLRVEEE
jgi:hypothetical protein